MIFCVNFLLTAANFSDNIISRDRSEKMKRKLRPQIRVILQSITAVIALFLISINDFNLAAVPLLLALVMVLLFNLFILENF